MEGADNLHLDETKITIETPVTGTVMITITARDVEHWIDDCNDQRTLRYLSRYARTKADAMDTEPDDFRSRA